MMYRLDAERLNAFSTELDLDFLNETLKSFERICNGNKEAGVIAQFDIPERFRWLTAMRSSCIQTSRPHPGFSDNLDKSVEKLFDELVM